MSTAFAAHQHLGDLERLLAVVGLRHQQVVDVDAERLAYSASRACSASMKAATPPRFCAWPAVESASVVLPDDSGPKISTTRPRGKPPMPMA